MSAVLLTALFRCVSIVDHQPQDPQRDPYPFPEGRCVEAFGEGWGALVRTDLRDRCSEGIACKTGCVDASQCNDSSNLLRDCVDGACLVRCTNDRACPAGKACSDSAHSGHYHCLHIPVAEDRIDCRMEHVPRAPCTRITTQEACHAALADEPGYQACIWVKRDQLIDAGGECSRLADHGSCELAVRSQVPHDPFAAADVTTAPPQRFRSLTADGRSQLVTLPNAAWLPANDFFAPRPCQRPDDPNFEAPECRCTLVVDGDADTPDTETPDHPAG